MFVLVVAQSDDPVVAAISDKHVSFPVRGDSYRITKNPLIVCFATEEPEARHRLVVEYLSAPPVHPVDGELGVISPTLFIIEVVLDCNDTLRLCELLAVARVDIEMELFDPTETERVLPRRCDERR